MQCFPLCRNLELQWMNGVFCLKGSPARTALVVAQIALLAVTSTVRSFGRPPVQIRVRIVSAQTHQPMRGRRVQIDFYGTDSHWLYGMAGSTDSDGVVIVNVNDPVPPKITVGELSDYACSAPEFFPTSEILKTGVIAGRIADKQCVPRPDAPALKANVTELVVTVHRPNRWQNFWYRID